jgi:hypothetical protein
VIGDLYSIHVGLLRIRKIAPALPAFLLSALPLSNAVSANFGVNPINWAVVFRLLLIGFAVTTMLLLALRPLVRDLIARAVFVSVFFLVMSFYGFVVFTGRSRGWNLAPGEPGVAAAYTGLSLVIALLFARPWKRGRRDPIALTMVSIAVLGMNAFALMSHTAKAASADWRNGADRLTAQVATSRAAAPPSRNIYYIVVDAFGRADTVNRFYGADLSGFMDFLRSRGFFVAEQARSNYAQTYLALAALMNLRYLDPLVAAVGQDAGDYLPLYYVIQKNALMDLARRAGYQVVGIGSDYEATMTFPNADRCYCERSGLDDYTQTVIAATPLAALLGKRPYAAHRDKVLKSFDAVEAQDSSSGPQFVFAHILSPHPPFIFSTDGLFRPPRRMFALSDGSDFPGSREDYVRGYHDQVLFVAKRLTALVDSILARPGPKPVIIMHGDHGPGSMLQWEDAAATNMTERMDIFAAYYFPDGGTELYPSITPVNGARALANQYLGAHLPMLPDRTMFSTGSHPYRFIAVPKEGSPVPAPNEIAGH